MSEPRVPLSIVPRLPLNPTVSALRADDFLSLEFEFVNLQVFDAQPRKARDDDRQSRLHHRHVPATEHRRAGLLAGCGGTRQDVPRAAAARPAPRPSSHRDARNAPRRVVAYRRCNPARLHGASQRRADTLQFAIPAGEVLRISSEHRADSDRPAPSLLGRAAPSPLERASRVDPGFDDRNPDLAHRKSGRPRPTFYRCSARRPWCSTAQRCRPDAR
jgi:hypothetical protein